MKKNITINLCGRLFNIDEDAYELLRNYMDTLHNYFKGQKGGEEIADDIEQRIAELLDEMKEKGVEAINIDHIKDVINRIGQPEQMDGDNEDQEENGENFTSSFSENPNDEPKVIDRIKDFFKNKRFYRNPKDKMLAGVISGFASTFEIDVTILRLLVVVLAILMGAIPFPFFHFLQLRPLFFFILTYCVLAVIMPEAETPEQQLKMQGKPINMSNLTHEVVQNVTETAQKVKESSGAKSVLNAFMKFLTGLLKGILVIVAIVLFFMGAITVVWAILSYVSPTTVTQFFDWNVTPILNGNQGTFNVFLIALIMALLIPAYVIIYCLNNRMGIMQRITWLLAWLVALATAVMTGITLTNISLDYERHQYQQSHTKDNIVMSDEDMDYLVTNNWTVVKSQNCDRFTTCGQHYSGDENIRYLDDYDDRARMRMKVIRNEKVMPGKYRLSAVVRSENRGPILFVTVNGDSKQIEFPVTGNEGGSVWEDAWNTDFDAIKETMSESQANELIREKENITNANDGKGFGWTRIGIDNIIINEETFITYGISTNTGFMHAKWFSACDVELTRIENK